MDFPWHIISYHSRFRNIWNLFITIIIIYEVLWYPAAVTFIYAEAWPLGNLVFEIVSIFIFLLDIIINIRTTYSNENNEEIIDSKMMKDNYLKSKLFIIDVISVIPLPEILLLIMMGSSKKWIVYSLTILLRMLRAYKVQKYTQHQTRGVIARLLKLFIIFFLLVKLFYTVKHIIFKDSLGFMSMVRCYQCRIS